MSKNTQRNIEVWADWPLLDGPIFMGTLYAAPARGKEIFSFEYDDAQDLSLARDVAPFFRVQDARANEIIDRVGSAVRGWRAVAKKFGLSRGEQERMALAFERTRSASVF